MADLRELLEEAVRESVRDPHPGAVAPILAGEADPTARDVTLRSGETISAEDRSLQSALAYHSVEGLFVSLTPLAMMSAAYFLLQTLSGDHPPLPEGMDEQMLDVWGELAPFRALLAPQHEGHEHERLTCAEECRRALWHLGQAYDAVDDGR